MGLLDYLETQLERQIPVQLQTTIQQAPDDCQPLCNQRHLAMHRHHRRARAIATSGFPKNRDAVITLAARLIE